jgi:hypothetical protein
LVKSGAISRGQAEKHAFVKNHTRNLFFRAPLERKSAGEGRLSSIILVAIRTALRGGKGAEGILGAALTARQNLEIEEEKEKSTASSVQLGGIGACAIEHFIAGTHNSSEPDLRCLASCYACSTIHLSDSLAPVV